MIKCAFYFLSAILWRRQRAECLSSNLLRAIDWAPVAENQSRLRFPGENYQTSTWDVKYQGLFFFSSLENIYEFLGLQSDVWRGLSCTVRMSDGPLGLRIKLIWPADFLVLVGNFSGALWLPDCVYITGKSNEKKDDLNWWRYFQFIIRRKVESNASTHLLSTFNLLC